MTSMTAAGASDLGPRADQEDAWFSARRSGALLAAVCDGMGGSLCSGRTAADFVIGALARSFAEGCDAEGLARSLQAGHRELLARAEAAKRQPLDREGTRWLAIATTVDCALFVPGFVHLAHAGDGRIYRFAQARLEPLTASHTARAAVQREHASDPPEALRARLARIPAEIVLNLVGMPGDLNLDRVTLATTPGDVFILCSDELYRCVTDDAISDVVARGRTQQAIATGLVAAANRWPMNRKDNLTVAIHVVGGDGI